MNFKLTQSDTEQDFAMQVPIYLDLANGRIARLGTGSESFSSSSQN